MYNVILLGMCNVVCDRGVCLCVHSYVYSGAYYGAMDENDDDVLNKLLNDLRAVADGTRTPHRTNTAKIT